VWGMYVYGKYSQDSVHVWGPMTDSKYVRTRVRNQETDIPLQNPNKEGPWAGKGGRTKIDNWT
jgi:hypothetical protein